MDGNFQEVIYVRPEVLARIESLCEAIASGILPPEEAIDKLEELMTYVPQLVGHVAYLQGLVDTLLSPDYKERSIQ